MQIRGRFINTLFAVNFTLKKYKLVKPVIGVSQNCRHLQIFFQQVRTFTPLESGCGAVDKAVTSDIKDPGFESSPKRILLEHLFISLFVRL